MTYTTLIFHLLSENGTFSYMSDGKFPSNLKFLHTSSVDLHGSERHGQTDGRTNDIIP